MSGRVAALPQGAEIFADAEMLARAAALHVVEALAARPEGPVAVALSGGSTPRRLYQFLAGPHRSAIDWARIHWFWGHERLVPATSDDSNARMAFEAMLDDAPAPPSHVHPITTTGVASAEAAMSYEAELDAFYGDDRLDPARATQ